MDGWMDAHYIKNGILLKVFTEGTFGLTQHCTFLCGAGTSGQDRVGSIAGQLFQ